MTKEKQQTAQTARATIGCAHFSAGEAEAHAPALTPEQWMEHAAQDLHSELSETAARLAQMTSERDALLEVHAEMLSALMDVQDANQRMLAVMPAAFQTYVHIVDKAIEAAEAYTCEHVARAAIASAEAARTVTCAQGGQL